MPTASAVSALAPIPVTLQPAGKATGSAPLTGSLTITNIQVDHDRITQLTGSIQLPDGPPLNFSAPVHASTLESTSAGDVLHVVLDSHQLELSGARVKSSHIELTGSGEHGLVSVLLPGSSVLPPQSVVAPAFDLLSSSSGSPAGGLTSPAGNALPLGQLGLPQVGLGSQDFPSGGSIMIDISANAGLNLLVGNLLALSAHAQGSVPGGHPALANQVTGSRETFLSIHLADRTQLSNPAEFGSAPEPVGGGQRVPMFSEIRTPNLAAIGPAGQSPRMLPPLERTEDSVISSRPGNDLSGEESDPLILSAEQTLRELESIAPRPSAVPGSEFPAERDRSIDLPELDRRSPGRDQDLSANPEREAQALTLPVQSPLTNFLAEGQFDWLLPEVEDTADGEGDEADDWSAGPAQPADEPVCQAPSLPGERSDQLLPLFEDAANRDDGSQAARTTGVEDREVEQLTYHPVRAGIAWPVSHSLFGLIAPSLLAWLYVRRRGDADRQQWRTVMGLAERR